MYHLLESCHLFIVSKLKVKHLSSVRSKRDFIPSHIPSYPIICSMVRPNKWEVAICLTNTGSERNRSQNRFWLSFLPASSLLLRRFFIIDSYFGNGGWRDGRGRESPNPSKNATKSSPSFFSLEEAVTVVTLTVRAREQGGREVLPKSSFQESNRDLLLSPALRHFATADGRQELISVPREEEVRGAEGRERAREEMRGHAGK